MAKIWLPPIETCCDSANFYFQLHVNLTLHLILECKTHGKHFIKNPLLTSKQEIKIIPSKKVAQIMGLVKGTAESENKSV